PAPGSDWELSDFQSIPVNRRTIQTASNPVVGPFVRFVIKLVCIADGRSVLDDEPRICGISSPEFKKDRAGEDSHNPIVLLRIDPEIRCDALSLDRYVSIVLSNRPPGCWALNPPILGIVGHEVDKLPFRKPYYPQVSVWVATGLQPVILRVLDRKSTRLNSSH